jgi:hypothetical protein
VPVRGLIAVLAVLVAIAAAVDLLAGSRSTPPPRSLISVFQDDQLLVYQPLTPAGTASVWRTLTTLRSLGVDRLRVAVQWGYVAPAVQPAGFDGSDPAAYPPSAWLPYDRVDRLAHAAGLQVSFDVTAPGPLWGMGRGAPNAKTATHWLPDAPAFGEFVAAVGRRYDGRYVPQATGRFGPLPRVGAWSVWNEPNQPGWLAPQWATGAAGATPVSAAMYRMLYDAAYAALVRTGHSPRTDTVLIGELAPEGTEATDPTSPMTPMPFLRAMYCVDSAYRPLRGAAASALGCPASGGAAAFVRANPGLFDATGFAHHPYSLFLAPDVSIDTDRNDVPISDLGRLERGLDRIFAVYGVSRRLPLYLTEYGYATNPPNPFRPISLAQQAQYLDEAEYLAWRDPRVRALSQFLLQDSAPNAQYPPGTLRYWSTFQTGLEFLGGRPKPALAAYRLPIWIPRAAGRVVTVWAMLRPAPNGTRQRARIIWQGPAGSGAPAGSAPPSGAVAPAGSAPPSGAVAPAGSAPAAAARVLATVSTSNPSGILERRVVVPGAGQLWLAWTSPAGEVVRSRAVPVGGSG